MTFISFPAGADAFGRLRTSGTGNRLDGEFIYDKQPILFDEVTTNGTVTHNSNTRDLTLSISDANNSTAACVHSHPVPYTPGNSQLLDITAVLDAAGLGGGTAQVFLRSKISGTVSEEVYDQADWDNLATGVDWTKSHIFSIDFQSLRVGTIRYTLVQSGEIVKVKQINNDNVRDSGYWQQPSLPVYWKLYNDTTSPGYTYMEVGYGNSDNAIGFRYRVARNSSAEMTAICCTVKSEAGDSLFELAGLPFTADMAQTAKTVSTTLIPLISIRPKTTFQSLDNLILAIPKSFSIQASNPIRYEILYNSTLTGASWTDVDTTNSSVEYDVTASAVSGGVKIDSDYIWANTSGGGGGGAKTIANQKSLLGKSVLWNRLGSPTGILTIAAIRTDANDASCLSTIKWEEIK